jgi:predicted double-glycine peptidase
LERNKPHRKLTGDYNLNHHPTAVATLNDARMRASEQAERPMRKKMKPLPNSKRPRALWIAATILTTSAVLLSVPLRRHAQAHAHAGLIYSATGWGGWVPASKIQAAKTPPDPLRPLRADYHAGHYAQVETEAEPFLKRALEVQRQGIPPGVMKTTGSGGGSDTATTTPNAAGSSAYATVRRGAEAELIAAYSAARRKEFPLAETRFVQAKELASYLPDHGRQGPQFGEPEPTLQEEAAYQEVVCVSAQGHREQAESGYRAFMQRYPQSILIHGALKRIARLHGGDAPKDAEAVWRHAMNLQAQAQKEQKRSQSLCAPECLAHLLEQRGQKADVQQLAQEMHTDENGTSLALLASTARQYGYHPRGLQVSEAGLQKQKLPAVALVGGGHFVVVEQVTPQRVTLWDPDAQGAGQGATRQTSVSDWQQAWDGITLTME